MRVNYGQTVHGEEEIAAVVNVLRTSTQMGPHVREFEGRVAALCGKRHGLMVNSGSSALYLAADVLDLPAGSEVITPVLTFATTVAPLVRKGLIPAFVDVAPGTYNIDVNQVADMISAETSALWIPNLIGNLPDWDRLRSLADTHGLKVLEDSADTLGASLHGRPTGAYSDVSTTSFYGSHVINCAGNGGMICVNDDDTARRCKLLRSWGRSSSLFGKESSEDVDNRFNVELDGIPYDNKFLFEEIGFNMEPSELGAAFGLVQLKKLRHNIDLRRRNAARHLAFFRAYEHWFVLPRERDDAYTGWLAFPLTIREDAPFTRTEMQVYLENHNIQTRPVFTGNILRQPGFSEITCRTSAGGYPVADDVTRGGILLGCHHGLGEAEMSYMHEQVAEFLAGQKTHWIQA